MAASVPLADKKRIPMEAPVWLQRPSRQQQAVAPYCGLGFQTGRLDSSLHRALLDQLERCAGEFSCEAPIDEIGSVEPGFFPTLHFEDRGFNDWVGA